MSDCVNSSLVICLRPSVYYLRSPLSDSACFLFSTLNFHMISIIFYCSFFTRTSLTSSLLAWPQSSFS
ncbi:hypothetical protein FGO68_gene15495 [Halteria grandinella]|uniref:Uncharacterized protein n=1 Tax=Halteria grandinella TaxID=5974 RepID=A0A8J8P2Y0_HALGN|nr:hypothetical protein FGO68_gene15495 [Halteria grandinella]